MSLKVYSVSDLPEKEWADLTSDSLFSAPKFASLWTTLNGTPLFFLEETAGTIVAGMAAVSFGSRLFARLRSMPEGLYGGPFYSASYPGAKKNEFIQSIVHYLQAVKYARADIFNPTSDINSAAFIKREGATHLLDLNKGLEVKRDPKREAEIKHGLREGGEVGIFDSDSYLAQFFNLAQSNMRRHGRKLYHTRAFYDKLLSLSSEVDRVLWLMIKADNSLAASHIYLIERDQILYWQSFFDRRYSHLKPNYLMLDYAFKFAQKKGLRYFNFGGSPENADSLVQFKEDWGGIRTSYYFYTYKNLLGRLYYSGKRR